MKRISVDVKKLGKLLKDKRTFDNLSLRDATKIHGIHPATLSRVENGGTPDIQTFAKLCHWYGVDMNFFVTIKNK
jgi:transcriptional regulator with XRE-family HTH domain